MTFFQILAGKHGLAITQQNPKKQKQLEIDPKSIGHYMAYQLSLSGEKWVT